MNKNVLIAVLVIVIAILTFVAFKPKERADIAPAPTTYTETKTTTSATPAKSSPTRLSAEQSAMLIPANENLHWPPVITHSSAAYVCSQGLSANRDQDENTVQRVINGRTYCIYTTTEGAAGTIYVTYRYTTPSLNQNGTETTTFTRSYRSESGTKTSISAAIPDIDAIVDSRISR